MKITRLLAGAMALCLSAGLALADEVVTPSSNYSTDISGTVTLGGTYQQVAAANSSRKNCTVQNPATATEALNVKIGTMAQPYILGAGQAVSALNGTVVAKDAITVTATTNGHAFAGTCQ